MSFFNRGASAPAPAHSDFFKSTSIAGAMGLGLNASGGSASSVAGHGRTPHPMGETLMPSGRVVVERSPSPDRPERPIHKPAPPVARPIAKKQPRPEYASPPVAAPAPAPARHPTAGKKPTPVSAPLPPPPAVGTGGKRVAQKSVPYEKQFEADSPMEDNDDDMEDNSAEDQEEDDGDDRMEIRDDDDDEEGDGGSGDEEDEDAADGEQSASSESESEHATIQTIEAEEEEKHAKFLVKDPYPDEVDDEDADFHLAGDDSPEEEEDEEEEKAPSTKSKKRSHSKSKSKAKTKSHSHGHSHSHGQSKAPKEPKAPKPPVASHLQPLPDRPRSHRAKPKPTPEEDDAPAPKRVRTKDPSVHANSKRSRARGKLPPADDVVAAGLVPMSLDLHVRMVQLGLDHRDCDCITTPEADRAEQERHLDAMRLLQVIVTVAVPATGLTWDWFDRLESGQSQAPQAGARRNAAHDRDRLKQYLSYVVSNESLDLKTEMWDAKAGAGAGDAMEV